MRHITSCIAMILALTILLPAQSPGGDETFRAKYYENAKVVRVKYVDGEAFVDRSYDEGNEEATINLPLFEKDMVETTDGRMEIYLGSLNYLRMDYDTLIGLEELPALRHTSLTMNIRHGGVYLDINSLEYERDIEIQTPDCGIFILGRGVLRINVTPGKGTEVMVKEGLVEVAGTGYNRDLRSGQKVVFLDGSVREHPYYLRTALSDDFDRWHRDRDRQLGTARYGASRYLDEGYSDYEYELSRYGRWQFNASYNRHIWIPHHLMDGWRPYYNGRWVWNPFYGYVWTSYDTWGWFTHHYGRWHWDHGMGWHWIPGYRWSPAWVAWYWGDNYYGWCPLSYWNRPVFVFNRRWHRGYHYWRGLPRHSLSTVIVRKDRLLVSHINRHALNRTGNGAVVKHTIPFRGNAPTLHPRGENIRIINAKGRGIVVKKGGLVNTNRYQSGSDGTLTRKVTKNRTTVVNRYSSGADTRGNVIRNYGRKTTTRRVVRKKTDASISPTHRYRSGSGSRTTSGRTTVKRTTTTRTRTTTVSKKTASSSNKSSKKPVKKKAKRKNNSPAAFNPTAHMSAPSGSSSSTYSASTHSTRRRYAPLPHRYQPRTRTFSSGKYASPYSSISAYLGRSGKTATSGSKSSYYSNPGSYKSYGKAYASPNRSTRSHSSYSSSSTRSYRSSSRSGSSSSRSGSSRSGSSSKARRR